MAKEPKVPGTYKHDGSYQDKMIRNQREEAADRIEHGDNIPGMRKNRASYEAQTLRNAKTRDIALDDTRVLDEEYDYTKVKWPGKMQPDENLSRGETMQIKHKPQIDADTTR